MRLVTNSPIASIATLELRTRIQQSKLEDTLAGTAFDLCVEGVPAEAAFQRIRDKALEQMVRMLDTHILDDAVALKVCLQVVSEESQRVAWEALEKGTEMLKDGLDMFDEDDAVWTCGPVN